ncbi:MAG: SIR2 family protein [Nitrospirae bacterium]|nr:SIR2 family protein [Nitrospirota bacterium]
MIINGRNSKTLIVLGAGATKGALRGTHSPRVTAPLNGDFFEVLRKYIRTNDGQTHRAAYDRLADFVNHEVGPKGFRQPTMEEVFSILFISKDLPEIFHKGRGRKTSVGYRPEIRDFLNLLIHLFRFVQKTCRPRDGIQHHDLLARSLQPHDVIVSLNYDTLVDNALFTAGWNPRKGYGFSARLSSEISVPQYGQQVHLISVRLLKPHGSLNWFAKGNSKNLEEVLERRPVSEIRMTALPMVNERKAQRLVRLFVPPLYSKFFRNQFWRKLWIATYGAAKDADQIVIIGCSLISTDFHLRAILSKAMNDKNTKYRRIVVVDPSDCVQKKMKKFFRGRSANGVTIYKTFSDLCRQVLSQSTNSAA